MIIKTSDSEQFKVFSGFEFYQKKQLNQLKQEQRRMLSDAFRSFMGYISNIFYRDLTIIDEDNLPQDEAVIVYGNHSNVFVDGMLPTGHIERKIHVLAAGVSCRKFLLGNLILVTGAIPVERTIDHGIVGAGKIIKISANVVTGKDTDFTTLTIGQSIELKDKTEIHIEQIISDTQLLVRQNIEFEGEQNYRVLPKLCYEFMYEAAWTALKQGKCVGIYPEGRSKDVFSLLPLKTGICKIALGAMNKYNIPVKLVPYGLTFPCTYQFRSKGTMQFGPSFEIPIEMLELYRKDRDEGINKLIQHVEKQLRALTIHFPHRQQTDALFIAGQLYSLSAERTLSIKEELQVNRRIARGYSTILKKPQFEPFNQKLLKFTSFVKSNGIVLSKNSLLKSGVSNVSKAISSCLQIISLLVLILPGLLMYTPAFKLSQRLAQNQRRQLVKDPKNPDGRKDTVASYIIFHSIYLMLFTALAYSFLLYFGLKRLTTLSYHVKLAISLGFFFAQPFYGKLLVKCYDMITDSWKSLKMILWSTFKRSQYKQFLKEKEEIQRQIIRYASKVGPEVVGDFEKNRIIKANDLIEELVDKSTEVR